MLATFPSYFVLGSLREFLSVWQEQPLTRSNQICESRQRRERTLEYTRTVDTCESLTNSPKDAPPLVSCQTVITANANILSHYRSLSLSHPPMPVTPSLIIWGFYYLTRRTTVLATKPTCNYIWQTGEFLAQTGGERSRQPLCIARDGQMNGSGIAEIRQSDWLHAPRTP